MNKSTELNDKERKLRAAEEELNHLRKFFEDGQALSAKLMNEVKEIVTSPPPGKRNISSTPSSIYLKQKEIHDY